MKGILSIEGMKERFVIQGVHSTLSGNVSKLWGDSPRESRVLIIGELLDRNMLETGFTNCLASSEN
jgi:G3E family GTPase